MDVSFNNSLSVLKYPVAGSGLDLPRFGEMIILFLAHHQTIISPFIITTHKVIQEEVNVLVRKAPRGPCNSTYMRPSYSTGFCTGLHRLKHKKALSFMI